MTKHQPIEFCEKELALTPTDMQRKLLVEVSLNQYKRIGLRMPALGGATTALIAAAMWVSSRGGFVHYYAPPTDKGNQRWIRSRMGQLALEASNEKVMDQIYFPYAGEHPTIANNREVDLFILDNAEAFLDEDLRKFLARCKPGMQIVASHERALFQKIASDKRYERTPMSTVLTAPSLMYPQPNL